MILLNIFEITLPLKNPILIFSMILFIILFAPIILNKFKIPHLIGLIIAGAIIGPHGFGFMMRDSSIILFGTVGLLYIMFLAGLEIDLAEFKKNSGKSVIFGLYTFIIPMLLGAIMSYYYLNFSLPTSILLASMFASHTLISYPIVSKLGVAKNKAVNITIGGTMITDTLALLVLAAIVGMSTGEVNNDFWIQLGISIVVFGLAVMLGFPILGRWFFKRFDDNISQYIFVLAMVFLGAFLAEAAGIEGIIGAFLAGLALNRLIPHTSPLMNRIEFVGNALFIPFFLIGVGMLIDYRAFFKDFATINVSIAMTITAMSAKFIAAWLTQKTFKFSVDQRHLIFGLSNAQAAATLAAVLVGYNIILGETETGDPIRLLDETVLNGSILMILVTCTVASLVAQRGAQNIALSENSENGNGEHSPIEKILIATNDLNTTEELTNLSITIKSANNKAGLYALNIIDDESQDYSLNKRAKQILSKALLTATATDNLMHELIRYDLNVVNGITNVVREHKITDLILGLESTKGISNSFFGNLTEGILNKCNTTTLIYKPKQPLNTIKRHLIVVPDKAEKEIGFPFWLIKVWNIARNTGAKLVFYSSEQTNNYIKLLHARHPIESDFVEFNDWNDFLILAKDVKINDNMIIVMSRKDRPSYHVSMQKIPVFLNKYFQSNNYILIFPMQAGVANNSVIDLKNPSGLEALESLGDIGKTFVSIFGKK